MALVEFSSCGASPSPCAASGAQGIPDAVAGPASSPAPRSSVISSIVRDAVPKPPARVDAEDAAGRLEALCPHLRIDVRLLSHVRLADSHRPQPAFAPRGRSLGGT